MIKVIEAKTISDAWFQLIYGLADDSLQGKEWYHQDIQSGSFEGNRRRQYKSLAVSIEFPSQDMVPEIPAHLGIPSPTTKEYIEDYFANYLMNPELAENETYKYASRIHELVEWENYSSIYAKRRSQFELIIDMLKKTPLTNQAVIEIATPSDVVRCVGNDGKLDPPCLRLIDFKVVPIYVALQHEFTKNTEFIDTVPCTDVSYYHCMRCNNRWVAATKIPCQKCHPMLFKGDNIIEDQRLILTISVYFRSWDLWAGFPTNLGGLELLKQYVAQECNLVNGPMYAYSAGAHIYGFHEELAKIRTRTGGK